MLTSSLVHALQVTNALLAPVIPFHVKQEPTMMILVELSAKNVLNTNTVTESVCRLPLVHVNVAMCVMEELLLHSLMTT